MHYKPSSSKVHEAANPRIAVVGAGVAGAACADGLKRAGFDVTVFDKSRGVGGRMATRRAEWRDADGVAHDTAFDHGCPGFKATRPRFKAVVERAVRQGHAARWQQRLYATFPTPRMQEAVVPTPNMPAFCRHLLEGVPQRLGGAVVGLARGSDGWHLQLAGGATEGPYDQVALAMPAPQAATLLAAHEPDWADALDQVRVDPCWTLMAVSAEVDWPWDVAEIEHSELGWVIRNDRKPGRSAGPDGLVSWIAHATPAWSLAHLEDDPASVCSVLSAALARLLPCRLPDGFSHAQAHRWRHSRVVQAAAGGQDCWWDAELGLGVCGDAFGDGSVQAAWCSGDELADCVAASLDAAEAQGRDGDVPIEIVVPKPIPTPVQAPTRSPLPSRSPSPGHAYRLEPGLADQPH